MVVSTSEAPKAKQTKMKKWHGPTYGQSKCKDEWRPGRLSMLAMLHYVTLQHII